MAVVCVVQHINHQVLNETWSIDKDPTESAGVSR